MYESSSCFISLSTFYIANLFNFGHSSGLFRMYPTMYYEKETFTEEDTRNIVHRPMMSQSPSKDFTSWDLTVLPVTISCPTVFSWISLTVWNLFPFKGDFNFGKSQKLQDAKSGSLVVVWIKSWATAVWCFFCCGSRSHRTSFATTCLMPRCCVKILDTGVLGIPRSASSSHAVSHWSLLFAAFTLSTLLGILLGTGLLECGSLSTLSFVLHSLHCPQKPSESSE